ncbi:exodeoxyribonuclease V beta chain [Candidatus Protochlamydia naegleriophila]|uniref:RecBCD enzyme subunit RecB n=1 Tax=Candidatus Protochlamydia naegleriophila TaxID=389348 RepID=A0A0U5JEQ8_9BACT|nr:exodeoxyribonuclease V subunit beta [Candidatus Protochlamydia naegleriophila]CUI17998.1 exodeoxyribonuclease V beta chain [Candidatus Protochlamydia naegleriophila]
MMKKFNVLDRQMILHQHYLLEASAGTGKTFSIQNIVVRLLIESQHGAEPLPLNKILVVTFTRAATRDLRLRIRSNIEQALHSLNEWINSKTIAGTTPDYLKAFMEDGEECVQKAKKRLQQALFGFDQAQIFTIHSFCSRMLKQYAMESDMGFHAMYGEETLPQSEILAVIRDFFRTEVRLESYSPAQLDIVLKEDPDQKKLLRTIKSGYDFEELPTFRQLYLQFVAIMYELKQIYPLQSLEMLADFQAQSASYRNYKSGETKAETLAKVARFAALFDQEEWTTEDFDKLIQDDLVWTMALDPKLLKSRKVASDALHYPTLTQELKQRLEPLVLQAGSFPVLLTRLARDCQKLLRRYQREEEKLSPDDLLRKMDWALDQAHFLEQIQLTYQAAIIDEFQDTDPIQWQIFRRLFIPDERVWTGYLYLVGDPKQSIYSFRQADIYTYLAAAQALGEHHCYSLDVNYRSQPHLVNALNALFSSENTPRLIPLPKKDFYLPYQPVFTSPSNQDRHFQDEKGAVHFFIGDGSAFKRPKWQDLEDKVFFPFIVQEIRRLQEQKGFAFRQFAVLVRDRHQALRLAEYFDAQQVPYLNQRGTSLAESTALTSLIDLIRAILHPHDRGAIRTALGTPLLGWNHAELKTDDYLEPILAVIQRLRQSLAEKGFAFFFQEFLQSSWRMDGISVLEHLLSKEGGLEFYHDLQQIADIAIDHRYREWNGPEGLIPFLDKFQLWQENDDERVKRFQDPSKDGVKILTLHFSKGLEFDIVFALGLAQRSGMRNELIPIEKEGQLLLTPLVEECEEHHRFCEETDAEKMRQLYVAMTRAKYQLYIPISLHFPTDRLAFGDASPIDLFLGRLWQPACSYGELYERIKQFNGKIFLEFIQEVGSKHHISYSIHEEISLAAIPKQANTCIDLKQPSPVEVVAPELIMASFSSLNHPSITTKRLLKAPPHDFNHPIKDVHTLPASSDTGVFIHQLLEKLSFGDFYSLKNSQEALPLVRPLIQRAAFKDWESVLADLAFNVMHADLGIHTTPFCLAELEPWQHYREMSFLFPYESSLALEGLMEVDGLIKGIVDLIFVHQKRYYIIDWKSNWLGNSPEDYHQSHLHEAMVEHGYLIQAKIYTEALKRYLSLVEPRPFEACFGGTLYLFLRGMQAGKQTGIYTIAP